MSRRVVLILIGAIIGLAGGFAYWYFIGCEEGCAIRSSWWKMSLYGGFMGGLALDSIRDLQERRQQKVKNAPSHVESTEEHSDSDALNR
jgi:hypothetical protein